MAEQDQITLTAKIARKQPDLPRFAVVPAFSLASWRLTGTTVVEVTINGVAVARRTIKRWDGRQWFISILEEDCRRLGVETGMKVDLKLRVATAALPEELAAVIETEVQARQVWSGLSESRQRMVREYIASGKQARTRMRRARKALLGE